jgi:hypothetical protein
MSSPLLALSPRVKPAVHFFSAEGCQGPGKREHFIQLHKRHIEANPLKLRRVSHVFVMHLEYWEQLSNGLSEVSAVNGQVGMRKVEYWDAPKSSCAICKEVAIAVRASIVLVYFLINVQSRSMGIDGDRKDYVKTTELFIEAAISLRRSFDRMLPARQHEAGNNCGDGADGLDPRRPLAGIERERLAKDDQVDGCPEHYLGGQHKRRAEPSEKSCHFGSLAC